MKTKQWSVFDWPLRFWNYMIHEFGAILATTLFFVFDAVWCFYAFPYAGHLVEWEARVRHAGMYLELFGLTIAVLGIISTQVKLNNMSGVIELLKAFPIYMLNKLKRFPMPWKNVRIVVGTMNAVFSPSVSAVAVFETKTGESIEERLGLIESRLEYAFKRLDVIRTEYIRNDTAINEALAAERSEREMALNENKRLIIDVTGGDYHIEVMGLVWLLVGIILGTASNELALYAKLLSPWIPTP